MEAALKNDHQSVLNEQKKEVRDLIMAGLEQIKDGLDEDEILAKLGVRMDYYKNYKIYYTTTTQMPPPFGFSRFPCARGMGLMSPSRQKAKTPNFAGFLVLYYCCSP